MNWKVRWVCSFIAAIFTYSFIFLGPVRSQEVKEGTERDEKDVLIKRLEVRDKMLAQFSEEQVSLDSVSDFRVIEETREIRDRVESTRKLVESQDFQGREISPVKRTGRVFLSAGILFIFSLGFLLRLFKQKVRTDNRNKELKLELEKAQKGLEQEMAIRKTIEGISLQKEKEFDQLKNVAESFKFELQNKDRDIAREKDICESLKEALSKKEAQEDQTNISFESLKRELGKKEDKINQNEVEPDDLSEKSGEKRFSKRVSLTKDFNRTVILRIKSAAAENIKCFAGNISSGGLCFEIKREFNLKEPINFRLFFYGDKVPIIKAKGYIVWEKKMGEINHYGISFDLLDDKDKAALNSYVAEKA